MFGLLVIIKPIIYEQCQDSQIDPRAETPTNTLHFRAVYITLA